MRGSEALKKILYFILLAAELFVGTLLMISLFDSSLYIPVAITVISVVALLAWQIALLLKAVDVAVKRRILFRIALIMMIPVAVFAVVYIVIAAMMVIAFA